MWEEGKGRIESSKEIEMRFSLHWGGLECKRLDGRSTKKEKAKNKS